MQYSQRDQGMSRHELALRHNLFSENVSGMLYMADSDLKIVTKTGVVATNKMTFFGLLPSMRNLLCLECSHEGKIGVCEESYQRND